MDEHSQAKFIIETLAKAGFVAYYAGGWVRDFLLGHQSDDIDIATNAPPETIQVLFSKTVPIGIAFGIILVIVDGHEYEVATFRNDFDYKDGRRPSRIEFTTAIEDAKRRDFTINGMFYDPIKNEVLDYVHGKEDLKAKIIRAIGNPHERIKEDRLRMIRAIRLACRFHFTIDPATELAIRAHATELFPSVAIERVVQELEKAHKSRKLSQVFIQLHQFGLLCSIFPSLKNIPLLELEQRVTPLQHIPHKAPLIAFLLELFKDQTLQDQLDLCKRLKTSKSDTDFVQFLFNANRLIGEKASPQKIDLVHFYAHPFAAHSIEIIAARFSEVDRETFLKKHQKQKTSLQNHIDRLINHTPIVQAKDLIKEGIKPSKSMGILLKEAEAIAINQDLTDASTIINQLKTHPEWT